MNNCRPQYDNMTLINRFPDNPENDGNGMGFLPGAVAAGSVAGPIGTVVGAVVGVVGTLFSKLFGGGDDQATKYRPPANSAEQFVHIADQYGDEYVSYRVDAASLAEAASRGNRADDIYSYYSAFISNSPYAGASSAARRVLQDASDKYGISISRAADWILNTAGITRIVSSFAPGAGQQSGTTERAPTSLPGYCPVGTYHPYPIGHPQQDLCAPFPEWMTGSARTTQQRQSPQTSGATQPARTSARPLGIPPGYWLNPATGMIEPIPACPAGLVFDEFVGRCVAPGELTGGDASGSKDNSLLWLLLIAAGVLVVSDRGSGGGKRR